jgi:tetratricopeptide (TPR) repeat protein
VQEVAYRSLLSERRRGLHAAVAAELEKTLPDPSGGQAGLIAYHWEEAGNPKEAASYYMKAATWYGTPDPAGQLAWHGARDPARALDAWKQVRRLLIGMPLEGEAKVSLISAGIQILNMGLRSQSLSAADAEPYYLETMELARSVNKMRRAALATVAYGRLHENSGSSERIVAAVQEMLSTLDDRRDASLKVFLTTNLAYALRLTGDLPRALKTIDEALARMHEVAEIDERVYRFSLADFARSSRGRILAMMGRCDEARPLLDELCGSSETFIRIQAHVGSIDMAWGLNDIAQASGHLDRLTRLAEGSGNPIWLTVSLGYTGLVQSMRGEYSLAAESLNTALEQSRRRNAETGEARLLANLAYVQLCTGLKDEARKTAEEAASVARRRGTKIMLAYAEWVMGGPTSPAFKKLVAETGAELLMRLPYRTW